MRVSLLPNFDPPSRSLTTHHRHLQIRTHPLDQPQTEANPHPHPPRAYLLTTHKLGQTRSRDLGLQATSARFTPRRPPPPPPPLLPAEYPPGIVYIQVTDVSPPVFPPPPPPPRNGRDYEPKTPCCRTTTGTQPAAWMERYEIVTGPLFVGRHLTPSCISCKCRIGKVRQHHKLTDDSVRRELTRLGGIHQNRSQGPGIMQFQCFFPRLSEWLFVTVGRLLLQELAPPRGRHRARKTTQNTQARQTDMESRFEQ